MKRLLLIALIAVLSANVALAQSSSRQAGDWIIRGGIGVVDPKSNNLPSASVEVDSAVAVTLTGVYMITDAIGVELLASTPWEHDIEVPSGKIGETKQLPPTLSVQWYTPELGRVQPYLGLGLNWTLFFSEEIAGGDLDLDDSFGLAAQIGADIPIDEHWLVNFDVRWADIDTDAKVSGMDIGTVEVDPMIYSVNLGYKF